MAKQNKQKSSNKLRLIGGSYRSRTLDFPDVEGLRPTPDRVRETVFNWLQSYVPRSRCLDLFAGSGGLGLEAASRGAETVVMIEANKLAAKQLKTNIDLLQSNSCQIHNQTAESFLAKTAEKPFDIVFIDPPYQADMWTEIAELLESNQWLAEDAMIYLECPSHAELPKLPTNWIQKKDKKAGEVRYCLFEIDA